MPVCSSCTQRLDQHHFSKSQLRKKQKRKCKKCVTEATSSTPSETLTTDDLVNDDDALPPPFPQTNDVVKTQETLASIERLGVNVGSNTLFVEYRNHKDNRKYIRSIKLDSNILCAGNIDQLMTHLNEHENDIFSANTNRDCIAKLISSIDTFKTEKILKSGNETEIQQEKTKMDTVFAQNQVAPSDTNYVYDKRVTFSVSEDEVIPNDWDEDDEEI